MADVFGTSSRRREKSHGQGKGAKAVKRLPSLQRLQELFSYDPISGLLTRRVTTSSNAKRGDVVGSRHNAGYLQMQLDGKKYLVHRLIWLLHTGLDPEELEVDHANGDRSDNRWENLRLATPSEQRGNRVVKGYYRFRNKFAVHFRHRYVGLFDTEEEAAKAYQALAEKQWSERAGHHR